ncbi:Cytochrome c [Stieleria magnilauensis]|uniref:Cytochrome c n=2 Tax=Stieleria magnilauensis TaxID=2527963 RepID=A0ABX5XT31_9BACT|nr:Cytochrome c [Planctomycetes bacterium TBK1r]
MMLPSRTVSRNVSALVWMVGCLSIGASGVSAVSPETVAIGRQLFEKNWSPQNPALMGKDGLGPLFNGQSCAVCHRQGGIGGAGEAEFNAKSISIESMQVSGGPINQDVIRQAIRGFHPGFIDPQAGIVNSLSLAHHGGTSAFAQSRQAFMEKIPALFSDNGGSTNAAEVRLANATPILYTATQGTYQTTIHARMFQRNTTPLFGAGLIDQVTVKQLRAVEREQSKHPEISGRLATLASGGIGKFGWRGNVRSLLDFCDQACAAEVGLETRRINQPADPMAPAYQNPTFDISDSQIRAMAAFVAALPAPTRAIPQDSDRRMLAARGEQVFSSIGCAVCHRPSLGPAQGIYSDLLLHDMGPKSYDLNPADPYIVRATPVTRMDFAIDTEAITTRTMVDDTVMGTAYYGGKYSMEPGSTGMTSRQSNSINTRTARSAIPTRSSVFVSRNEYRFAATPAPPMTLRFVNERSKSKTWQTSKTDTRLVENEVNRNNRERTASGRDTYTTENVTTSTQNIRQTRTDYTRLHLETTYFTQEWRTPPLWGVHDSAPYMHDGRAETLLEAITMHEGESKGTRDRFLNLSLEDRQAVIEFLHTLVAPPNAPQPTS